MVKKTKKKGSNLTADKWELLWRKSVKNLRTWGLLAIFFFGLANALNFAVRGLENDLIWTMILGGVATGWFLARSFLSGPAVAGLSIIFGVEVALLRIGKFGDPLREALAQFFVWISQVISWQLESPTLQKSSHF